MLLAARSVLAGLIVAATVTVVEGAADAATIVQPATSPTVVANAPMTVVATGFKPGSPVFIEQCDGLAPTTQDWSPTIDCDNGASPPPAIAAMNGQAVFPAAKPDRAFLPFQGESPSSLFNCIAPGSHPPANTLPTFSNCQLRVSSNNAAVTDDQVFRTIVLSGRSVPLPGPATSTTVPGVSTTIPGKHAPRRTTTAAGAAATARPKPGHGATLVTSTTVAGSHVNGAQAAGATPGSTSASGSDGAGVFALSDGGVTTGYLFVLIGLLLAVLSGVIATRRRPRVIAPSVTGTETADERQ